MGYAFAQSMAGARGQYRFQELSGAGLLGGFFAGFHFGLIARLAQLIQVGRRLRARAMVERQDERPRWADLALVWRGSGRKTGAKGRDANESDEQVFHDDLLG